MLPARARVCLHEAAGPAAWVVGSSGPALLHASGGDRRSAGLAYSAYKCVMLASWACIRNDILNECDAAAVQAAARADLCEGFAAVRFEINA